MSIDVSVIIAAYNVEYYIERAIRSALDQDGVSVEVIVIDDGSTDNTFAFASSIADPRLKCKKMTQNGGPGAARNAGIAMASGTWIAVLDGDDTFEPYRLARCLERAKQTGADIVADNLTICRETDGAVFPMFPPLDFARLKTLDLAAFIKGRVTPFSNYTLGYLKPVFAAAFLKRHKLAYPEDLRIGEDYLLLAEALANGALCAIEPVPGYLYTVRTGSVSHRLSSENAARMIEGDARFRAHHRLKGAAAKVQRRRTRQLRDAYHWALLVEALKRRNIPDILTVTCRSPASLRHLWKPVWVRLQRACR